MSKATNKFAPEVRVRAVRMAFGHKRDHPSRRAAAVSITEMVGCIPQTPHEWVNRVAVNSGERLADGPARTR